MPLSRFSRRHERTFGKEKEEWNGDFRKPPKPDSYWTKQKGQCRWCGLMIVKEDGTRWAVPLDEANTDYQAIQQWISEGNTVIDNGE